MHYMLLSKVQNFLRKQKKGVQNLADYILLNHQKSRKIKIRKKRENNETRPKHIMIYFIFMFRVLLEFFPLIKFQCSILGDHVMKIQHPLELI